MAGARHGRAIALIAASGHPAAVRTAGRPLVVIFGLQYGDTGPTVPTLTIPTRTQRRAFELLHAPIPITLK